MVKRQKGMRISDLTDRQLADLKRWWGISTETEVITVIIDRAWHAEAAQRQAAQQQEPQA